MKKNCPIIEDLPTYKIKNFEGEIVLKIKNSSGAALIELKSLPSHNFFTALNIYLEM